MSAISKFTNRFLHPHWRKLFIVPLLLVAGVFALVGKHQEQAKKGAESVPVSKGAPAQPGVPLSSPTLIAPAEMTNLVIPQRQPIEFSWTQVPGASHYRIRIFPDAESGVPVHNRKVDTTSFRISDLAEGRYYWVVQSIDAEGKESGESERNHFALQVKVPELSIELEVLELIKHGHVIQVRGRTQLPANVMVNGQFVPNVNQDGSFDYFTPLLGDGENTISITAQNSHGGVRTIRKTVTIN
ncbi:MAG: hypothetical protein AB7O65_14415 [Candidatus Korobacteraceae bacterium]